MNRRQILKMSAAGAMTIVAPNIVIAASSIALEKPMPPLNVARLLSQVCSLAESPANNFLACMKVITDLEKTRQIACSNVAWTNSREMRTDGLPSMVDLDVVYYIPNSNMRYTLKAKLARTHIDFKMELA